jgi:hypothetical protein
MLRLWASALVWALALGGFRLVADATIPPHPTWWFTAFVAISASLMTSYYWIHVHGRSDVR